MRGITLLAVVAGILGATALPSAALTRSEGELVRGKYFASGKVAVAGVTIRFEQTKVSINANGRVRGFVMRAVYNRGVLVSRTKARLTGSVTKVTRKGGRFHAPARFRAAGSAISGEFRGLTDPSAKLSRYFQGKIGGSPKSNFVLRAR